MGNVETWGCRGQGHRRRRRKGFQNPELGGGRLTCQRRRNLGGSQVNATGRPSLRKTNIKWRLPS